MRTRQEVIKAVTFALERSLPETVDMESDKWYLLSLALWFYEDGSYLIDHPTLIAR